MLSHIQDPSLGNKIMGTIKISCYGSLNYDKPRTDEALSFSTICQLCLNSYASIFSVNPKTPGPSSQSSLAGGKSTVKKTSFKPDPPKSQLPRLARKVPDFAKLHAEQVRHVHLQGSISSRWRSRCQPATFFPTQFFVKHNNLSYIRDKYCRQPCGYVWLYLID